MILENNLQYFTAALSNKFCDEILEYALTKKQEVAQIVSDNDLDKNRKSSVVFLNDTWIFKEVEPYLKIANKESNWNFDIESCEPFQFTKYDGLKKQHYSWHVDQKHQPFENGLIRKLSMTISLVDGSSYEGGDLEFSFRDGLDENDFRNKICNEIRPKGSIVVFPSFTLHRVKPVTAGTRYSLVVWTLGKPFR